jgi:putative transposase
MKKYSESQILGILKECEGGVPVKELSRKHGFYPKTFYEWKKKYGGISSTQELQRLKELEQENARLKKMYAELSLDHAVLKEVIEKKL